jgi:group II intron reverse transcriptase/maturase
VSDGSILRLVKGWLRAPVVEATADGRRQRVGANRQGTPQGGVISPWLANLYLNGLDHAVNEQCEQKPRLVRYADDFVIACRPGQGVQLMARTQRWLERRGLKLNQEKTRLVNLTQEGIDFLGFGLTWRQGQTGKSYPHVEPNAKSRAKLRKKLGQILNHWTLHQSVEETVQRVNRVVQGWINYFHYANSSGVFTQMQHHTRNRLRRWLWRKHGCRKGLFKQYTNASLHDHYGLRPFPLWTRWQRAAEPKAN